MAHALTDAEAAAVKAIHDHVGYVEQWRVFPVDDRTDDHWHVANETGGTVYYSPDAEQIRRVLADDGDLGEALYSGQIYTQRHHEKWVFRGAELTAVLVDTRCDLNVFLMVFRNDLEVKSDDH